MYVLKHLPVQKDALLTLEAFLRLFEVDVKRRKMLKEFADQIMFCVRHASSAFTATDYNTKRTFTYKMGNGYVWGFAAYGTIYRYFITPEDYQKLERLRNSVELTRAVGKWVHKLMKEWDITLGGLRVLVTLTRYGVDVNLDRMGVTSFASALKVMEYAKRYIDKNGVPTSFRLAPRVLPGTGLKATPENIKRFAMPPPQMTVIPIEEEESVDFESIGRDLRRLFYSQP